MRIAIYQPRVSYYVGGGEVVPLEMAKNFSLHGHEVTIVTSRHPNGNSDYFDKFVLDNPNVKIDFLELPSSLKWIYSEKPGTSQLRWDYEAVHVGRLAQTYFERNLFDVLNVHYNVDILASNPKFKTVLFLHGVPKEPQQHFKIWFSFPNVKYISVSKYIGQKWSDMVDGLKYDVFTNGIDTKSFYPMEIQKDIDVMYFGRLVPVKGVEYLIDAVQILKDRGLNLRVVIAGNGNQKENLESQAKNLNLLSCINFVGYVPQEEVLSLYNRSKLFVAPSFDREGVLTTLLEAASCGIPTVTTNSCSMPEFVDHGINGLLAKPQDSKSLADEIEKSLTDDNFRKKIGDEARKKAETWNWDKKAKKLEEYFVNAINE